MYIHLQHLLTYLIFISLHYLSSNSVFCCHFSICNYCIFIDLYGSVGLCLTISISLAASSVAHCIQVSFTGANAGRGLPLPEAGMWIMPPSCDMLVMFWSLIIRIPHIPEVVLVNV